MLGARGYGILSISVAPRTEAGASTGPNTSRGVPPPASAADKHMRMGTFSERSGNNDREYSRCINTAIARVTSQTSPPFSPM